MHGPIFCGEAFNHHRGLQTIIIQRTNYCGGGGSNIFSGLGSMFAGICAGLSIASLFSGRNSGYPMNGGMGMQPIFTQMPTQMPTEMPMPIYPSGADAQVESMMNNLRQNITGSSTTPATTSEPKPAENNLGAKFDEWSQNNASKYEKGETVEDFAFVGDDYAKDIKENEGKNAATIYKNGIMKLSQDTIKLQDTNGNGTVNYDEYIAKERADYKKAFPSDSMPPEGEEVTRKNFRNMDLDNNGEIDEKEMAAVYALYDKNIETGESNGKIRMKDFVFHSQELPEDGTKDKLKKRYDFLFSA